MQTIASATQSGMRVSPARSSGTAVARKRISARQQQYDIVVFSHLRWDSAYQRPHHIITRLARYNRILFVEEPVKYDHRLVDCNTAKVWEADHNITVFQPVVNSIGDMEKILSDFLRGSRMPLAWFYSPVFAPLLKVIPFGKVIYDCMDELAFFTHVSPELKMLERNLLSEADIVFTGGKSLFELKYKVHNNVYCFPGSVERKHFEKTPGSMTLPEDMVDIAGPVIGYHGIINNHVDIKLVHDTAELCPGYTFVLVGPVSIPAGELPVSSNVRYVGQKSYQQLPAYVRAFDVAMLPIAINEATRFISPSNTLEYMAAGKPIVSTPVHDVIRDYKSCVHFAASAPEFSTAITNLVEQMKVTAYTNRYFADILDSTSWDFTAKRMAQLIVECSPDYRL